MKMDADATALAELRQQLADARAALLANLERCEQCGGLATRSRQVFFVRFACDDERCAAKMNPQDAVWTDTPFAPAIRAARASS